MYTPLAFNESNLSTLHEFIEHNSFGLLVSQQDGSPFATHVPFLLDRKAGASGTLFGHLALANPQCEQFVGQRVLAVFSGPHAYISPAWYEAEQVVPTWNYVAVHVYGRVELVQEHDELLNILRRSVEVYERSMPRPWSLSGPDTFVSRMLKQIVGFRIEVERLEGKWKLSQNQPVERQEKVIRALIEQGDNNSANIADLMQRQLGDAPLSDEELLCALENGTITPKQWNHRAHVRGGYLLMQRFGLTEGTARMQAGLKRLNAAHGSPNTLMRGYHETITVAYLRLIFQRLIRTQSMTSQEFCDVHPELLDKHLLLRYYTPDRLWSQAAKQGFLEPDVKSFDIATLPDTSKP